MSYKVLVGTLHYKITSLLQIVKRHKEERTAIFSKVNPIFSLWELKEFWRKNKLN